LAGLTFDASIPQLSLNGGFFTVDTTDGLQLNSVHALSPDGTASFATGAFTIQPDGSTAIGGSVNIGGGVITLDPSDGSISSGPGIFSLNGTTGVLELASGWHWEPNGTGTWGAGAAAFGAGTISKYNGNTTAGNGVASIVGSFNNTATNANIASTTLFTPASTGLFEVSVVQLVTTAGTAGTLSTTIAWTDEVGATTATPAAGLTVATTGRDSGIIVISATAGNAISFSSSLSGLVGTTTYRVKVAVKRLQ
jgi:hypothetical protein